MFGKCNHPCTDRTLSDYFELYICLQGNFPAFLCVYIPLRDQLIELLQRPDIGTKIDHRFTRIKRNKITMRIFMMVTGQLYQQICAGKLMNDQDALSISFNCDEFLFQSSNFSIWPLQEILNELPTKEFLGLWFWNTNLWWQHSFTHLQRKWNSYHNWN